MSGVFPLYQIISKLEAQWMNSCTGRVWPGRPDQAGPGEGTWKVSWPTLPPG